LTSHWELRHGKKGGEKLGESRGKKGKKRKKGVETYFQGIQDRSGFNWGGGAGMI